MNMILKKPYAFLIKHFRIIHMLLAIPMIYLLLRTGDIVQFFSDYINANYFTSVSNIAGTFINYFMYFAVIFILIVGIFIYFLMKEKEKSTKYYYLLIIFYVMIFVLIGITHGILSNMEMKTMEATAARAYRDISYLFYLPQFIFIAFTLFRGIGFDIKKFNFETDLQELEITNYDAEEFEFNINIDEYKWKRNIRRFIREIKYYIQENRFIFSILCAIGTIIIGTFIYLNFEVYHKTYKQSQTLSHNNLNIKVLDSMVTNRDYSGKTFKEDKYYLVLKLNINNKGKENQTFDYNSFFIELEERRVYPILDRAGYFLDYGLPMRQDTVLKNNTENNYVLVYELQKKELGKEYTLKILEQIAYQLGSIAPEYKTVSLKPYQAIDIKIKKETKLGKILTFDGTNIGYSSFQIKNYNITNHYSYQYNQCNEKDCRSLTEKVSANSGNTTLLILEGEYMIDHTTDYYKTARTSRLFPEHFLSVQYTSYDGSKKIAEAKNQTSQTYQKGVILETTAEILNASKIDLLITIRDQRYIINLKE